MQNYSVNDFVSENLEQDILGTLLRHPDKILFKDIPKITDFNIQINQDIFKEMLAQYEKNTSFSVVSIATIFKDVQVSEGYSAVDYISELAVSSSGFLNETAPQLSNLAKKRDIFLSLNTIMQNIKTMDPDAIISEMTALATETIKTEVRSGADILEDIKQGLLRPKKCYSTGIERLDGIMKGGLYEGFTYGFCGKEKSGKTTLAHSISYNLPCKHLYIAMEMGAKQIEERNIARDMVLNSLAFLDRPQGLVDRIKDVKPRENVFWLDCPGAVMQEIFLNITQSRMKHGIKGFIVDYWQLVGGQQKGESEEKHLRNVAQGFADYARKNKMWCILLAQMNQDGRLFGGNGLRKACDQLYMIEDHEEGFLPHGRWLRMDASRYTILENLGGPQEHGLIMNTKHGPYFE